jgi:cell division protein FtsQ
VKLFRHRRALAAGTVPPQDVFVEDSAETGDGAADGELTTPEERAAAITGPVPIVAEEVTEKPRLRFGFGDPVEGNGEGAERELVTTGVTSAGTATAGADGATGLTTTEGQETTAASPPRKVISIGFDHELDEIETISLDSTSAFATPSGSPVDLERPEVDARLRARWIQARRDEGRRRLRWAIAGGVLLTLLIAAGLVLESPLFAINDVNVDGAVYTNPARLQHVVDDLLGSSLIGADLGRAEATLTADPWVRRVRVERRPLRGVRIEIVERVPVATYMGADQRWRVLDPTGRVLAVLDPPGSKPVDPLELKLPEHGPDLEAGANAPSTVAGAADLIPRLPAELRTRTCSLGVGDVGQLTLNFCDGYIVDLGQPEDLRDKLVTTMFVLNSNPNVAASHRLNVADASHPVLIQ